MIALILVPACILSFFFGFYLQLLIKILVDMLNMLQKLVFKQEVINQQEELDKKAQSSTTFVEPQTLAEIEADEELERIKALNNQ